LPESEDPGGALKAIKEALRSIPQRGIGYGPLRYRPGTAAQLRALPRADMSFNYLGQFDQTLPNSAIFTFSEHPIGSNFGPDQHRAHVLDVGGSVVGGQLRMSWVYSACLHRRDTVEAWAHSYMAVLRELIHHCQSVEDGGHTPSDFPGARVNQNELEAFLATFAGLGDRTS
jgi:non-ribosomal peptide synthase protein (TIGR01720 family)